MESPKPLLKLVNICKQFGGIFVNDHISLDIMAGQVHALLGENGAGKSTLMNIVYGMYQPDAGQILVNGREVQIKSPRVSLENGIGMVHQNFMLVDSFSSSENVFLLGKQSMLSYLDAKKIEGELEQLAARYGIEVDLHAPVRKLSIGMQQRIEILKLLYTGANILIFDEPTAVLPPHECQALFDIIERLKEAGKAIIFISHKLDEVMQIADHVTILSHGRVTASQSAKELNKADIVKLMIGEDFDFDRVADKRACDDPRTVIELTGVSAKDERGVATVRNVNMQVKRGEIVGIASLEGNGQDELSEVLTGMRKCSVGSVRIHGREMPNSSMEFIKEGVAYVPADRTTTGTIRDLRLFENWILRNHKVPARRHFLRKKEIQQETANAIEKYDIRVSGHQEITDSLSGGNLQKFIIARELSKEPEALVCAYPTRGIDVKATWFIREQIVECRNRGCAVVVITGDFEELFYLADRICVLCKGEIVGEVDPKTVSVDTLSRMMMGVKADA